jgi:ligand-binding SRPBCC domain-containing protein
MVADLTTHSNYVWFGASPIGRGTRLEAAQFLAERRDRVFDFFSDAFQLENLTPPWLKFSVRTPRPIHIQEGTRIDYQLRLHGVPIRWRSQIEVWDPPHRFVDVQIRGPYRCWRHEHVFEEFPGGTLCRDIVDYEAPGGWLVDRLFVRHDVQQIFEYRQRQLTRQFPHQAERPVELLGPIAHNSLHLDA